MQNQGISTRITSKATSLLLYHAVIKSQKCQELPSTSASIKSLFLLCELEILWCVQHERRQPRLGKIKPLF